MMSSNSSTSFDDLLSSLGLLGFFGFLGFLGLLGFLLVPPTMTQPPRSNKLFRFIITFALVYLLTTLTFRLLFPEKFQQQTQEQPLILLTAVRKSVSLGTNVMVMIQNRTETGVTLTDRCPEPPFIIEKSADDRLYQIDLKEPAVSCSPLTLLPPKSTTTVDLSPWKYEAFKEPGAYRISLPIEATRAQTGTGVISTELHITSVGVFTSFFRAFITKPLLNGLILIASILPNHSLGWSIIILTIIVRFLLFFPSQHALHSQKKLQLLQPKIEEIKKKHKDNQKKITEETMALWKREKINPFQSCLPTLIQIPILFGLFFIVRDSNAISLARHLLYPPFLNLTWSFNTLFLGFLDLHYIPFGGFTSWIPTPATMKILAFHGWLPLTISLMQFAQMKMTFAKKKKGPDTRPLAERLDAQVMMMYMLPIMIFFIAGKMPAAVSLYWGASTLFSIGQQAIVNRKR